MEIRWSILFGRTINAEYQMFWIYHILMVGNPKLSIDVVTKKHLWAMPTVHYFVA